MKKAYHRLILPNGEVHPMVVCSFDADGEIIEWHTLQHEEANVVWVGGEIRM